IRPALSASAIMLTPMRSFTLARGFWLSSFATTSATAPFVTRFRRTSGVWPISSVTSFAIFIDFRFSELLIDSFDSRSRQRIASQTSRRWLTPLTLLVYLYILLGRKLHVHITNPGRGRSRFRSSLRLRAGQQF